MKHLWSMVLVAVLALAHADAEARRLGGGKSMGRQSSNVTQRQATPPAAAPGQPGQAATQNAAAKPATAPANAAAAAPKKPWGAMLGGLAAGLGLAWLANSLGLGEAFGNMLMMGLLALAAFAVIGMIMRARNKPAAPTGASAPLAFQGAGNVTPSAAAEASAPMARQYNPEKVGNDASARPWESSYGASAGSAAAAGGSMIGAALAGSQNWGVPEGFDTEGFLAAAKRNFMSLQAAWDSSDLNTLRSMMTDTMLQEIRQQLSEREAHGNGAPNATYIEGLQAQLLGIEELDDAYLASVEFSGMSREEQGAGLMPFREVWNMSKPKAGGSGWLVAGLQALQ